MKKYILRKCMKLVNKSCPSYNDEKLLEIEYGLEGMYLTITKCIILFIVALILGIFKEMIIIMLLYNGLRAFGFGLHATKSWICLVSSLIMFIGVTLIVIYVVIPLYIKVLILIICVSCFYLYAPADTEKHPLIKKRKRLILKITSIIVVIIYSFMCLYIDNSFVSNAILASILMETIIIVPITYKIFNLPYNNYKNYLLNN